MSHIKTGLFVAHVIAGISLALWAAPDAWTGATSAVPRLWTAVFVGTLLVLSCRRGVRAVTGLAARAAELEKALAVRSEAEAALARQAEDLRAGARRAEAAARASNEYLSRVSQDVRAPLNALILHCELLHMDAAGRLHHGFAEDLAKVRSAGNELLTLLNAIAALSKIEAGRMTVSLERFDVRALLQEVAQTVDPLMAQNGNRLAVYYADQFGPMHADRTKTRQILQNILNNAAKFTRGGIVTVDVGLDHTAARPTVFFAVSDTGVGMTPQQMVKVFDPGAPPGAATARHEPGTGLGLAVVSRFCRLMGGTVSVESCPGRGSRFIVRLPLSAAESSDAADAA